MLCRCNKPRRNQDTGKISESPAIQGEVLCAFDRSHGLLLIVLVGGSRSCHPTASPSSSSSASQIPDDGCEVFGLLHFAFAEDAELQRQSFVSFDRAVPRQHSFRVCRRVEVCEQLPRSAQQNERLEGAGCQRAFVFTTLRVLLPKFCGFAGECLRSVQVVLPF